MDRSHVLTRTGRFGVKIGEDPSPPLGQTPSSAEIELDDEVSTVIGASDWHHGADPPSAPGPAQPKKTSAS